ncbi:MAG: cation:proton antiporter subunit C [Erysipelotrichaceae bacterium]|nr:cation:proton antiporter subunit C [Erysipelotrichaceae bacterium]
MNIVVFSACLTLLIGLYGIVTSKQIVKTILCMNMVQTAIILILIVLASRTGDSAPIVGMGDGNMVDPLPQALMITVIVIGASITALALFMSGKIFRYYGSLNWRDIFERNE